MFIDRLESFNLKDSIGISIKGEGKPLIPGPGHKKWSKNALPSMAYGYNLRLTPLQTLNFYNAIANNGVMVKPRFIKEVRAWNETILTFNKEIINPELASINTISKIQEILKNIMVRGTGKKLYSSNFSMAGKTGTAQTEYWMKDWAENKRYISSFAGYFPAENPKYSCIVIIHKPSTNKGYYGADVSGPVFKRIAQKIFTVSPLLVEVSDINEKDELVVTDYEVYYEKLQNESITIPNVVGMAGMDAVSLLENIGLNVKIVGNGTVNKQSLKSGSHIRSGDKITLYLS
jgi:cell division protein FtsI (penicillin-binding protein 3)